MSEKPPPDSGGPRRTGASPASKTPARIGRYQIIERVGQSGMSILYRGIDPVLDREVAIKVMIGDSGDDLVQLRPRFNREARAVARLQHRNIVTVFEFGEDEGTPYIVMEFLRGASLSARTKADPPLTMNEKVDIVAQLCSGLEHAHEQGIVHRDVKPANIFLLTDGTVKLLDFGVARLTSTTLTRQGDVLGNASYMSPEQIMGLDTVDGRSDVFSAGALLFELLAGRRPFDGDTTTTTVINIINTEAPRLGTLDSTIPVPLETIVARALEKNPSQRFQKAGEFARALRSLRGNVVLPETSPIVLGTPVSTRSAAESVGGTGGLRVGVPHTRATSSLFGWLKRRLVFQKPRWRRSAPATRKRDTSAQLPANTVVDDVHFTLTSPARLRRGTSTEVIFWCHLDRAALGDSASDSRLATSPK